MYFEGIIITCRSIIIPMFEMRHQNFLQKIFAHFERPDSSSQDVGREHICVHVYTKILGIQVRKGSENNYNRSI